MDHFYHHTKFGGGRTSRAAGGGQKNSMFLFFSNNSITLLSDKVCARYFAMKTLEYVNGFGTRLTLQHWAEPPHSEKIENTSKFDFFAPQVRHNEPIEMKFDPHA